MQAAQHLACHAAPGTPSLSGPRPQVVISARQPAPRCLHLWLLHCHSNLAPGAALQPLPLQLEDSLLDSESLQGQVHKLGYRMTFLIQYQSFFSDQKTAACLLTFCCNLQAADRSPARTNPGSPGHCAHPVSPARPQGKGGQPGSPGRSPRSSASLTPQNWLGRW